MIKSINAFRFIFALAIFFHHLSINGKSLFYEGGNLAVTFFFILSGFILAYNYTDKFTQGTISYKNFMVKRLIKIFPLHWMTFLAALGLYFINMYHLSTEFNIEHLFIVGGVNVTLLQSWVPIPTVYMSFNSVSWFLSNMIFFYLMFPFLIKRIVSGEISRSILSFCSLLFLYAITAVLIPKEYIYHFFYVNPLFRIIDFVFGIVLYRLYNQYISKIHITDNALVPILEVSSIFLVVFLVLFLRLYESLRLFSFFYWIPLSVLIVVFVYSSSKQKEGFIGRFLSNDMFSYLGNISMCFFLIHQLVIRTLLMAGGYLGLDFHNIVGFITAFMLSLIAAIFCYHIIEKPSARYLNAVLIK